VNDSLTVELELEDRGAVVTVANESDEPAFVWSRANSWGWGTITLLVTPDGGEESFELRPPSRIFTRNGPGVVEIPAGGRHRFELNPGEEGWIGADGWAPASELLVRAVLDIPDSPEADELRVGVGRWESEPVPSHPPHRWLSSDASPGESALHD
jgi:hypothetical protein